MFLSSKEDKSGVKKPLLKSVVPYGKKVNKHFSPFLLGMGQYFNAEIKI